MTSARISAAVVVAVASLACAGTQRSAAPAAARPAPAAARPAPAAAVAANAASAPAAKPAADGSELVCRTERPIGSNIARRVCRTRDEIERERQATQDLLRRPRNPTQAPD